jgi:HK97 family phage major capsid protein
MNLEQLRKLLETARTELHERNSVLEAATRAIDEAQEGANVTELRSDFDAAVAAFDEQAEEVERCKRNLDDAERRQRVLDENPAPVREASGARQPVRTVEQPVYSTESAREGTSFFTDAYRFQFSADPAARERLERHGKQNVEAMRSAAEKEASKRGESGYQFRDVGTGAFAGLTIPQYLIDMFAPLARAGSPALNSIARKLPLPASGMTVNISRITTGAAAAAQASENAAVQETDIDDTLLTVNVRTYAGQQDVSRQSLERSEMVDAVVFQDLVADYYTKLDSAILNGDGTGGTHLGVRSTAGIVSVAYTDASPTVPELYPKLADAIRQINGGVFAKATAVLMHSRRWGWGTAALDSSNRPLFIPDANGPFNALAVGEAAGYGQVMGKLQGLPVITDDNLPTNLGAGTNEDIVLVVSGYNMLFWQEGDGSPRQFRFEQSNAPQSVRLAVWGYSAFSAGRYPGGSATVGGTGLVTPTF